VEKWEEAIQAFERAIQIEPRNIQAYQGLGWAIYKHTGNAEAARAVFERALAQKPDSWQVRVHLCDLYTVEGDYDAALRWIDEALASSPDNAELLWRLGRIYVLRGRYEQAREYCRSAIQADERSAPAHFWLGQSYFEQALYELALPGLEAAVQFMPSNVYYRLQLAHTYRLAQRSDDAIRAYRRVLEIHPGNPEATRWLATLQE
jgi:tetratricopeptide (TPR) repeat protein